MRASAPTTASISPSPDGLRGNRVSRLVAWGSIGLAQLILTANRFGLRQVACLLVRTDYLHYGDIRPFHEVRLLNYITDLHRLANPFGTFVVRFALSTRPSAAIVTAPFLVAIWHAGKAGRCRQIAYWHGLRTAKGFWQPSATYSAAGILATLPPQALPFTFAKTFISLLRALRKALSQVTIGQAHGTQWAQTLHQIEKRIEGSF